jgi:transposase
MSMQGVGVKTAASVLLTISDAGSSRTAGHLTAHAGIAPSRGVPGRPSEENSLPGRATNNSRTHFSDPCGLPPATPSSKAYWNRKRAEGKNHNAVVVCLARRRCDVIHSVLRNGTLYEEKAPHAA